MCLCVMSNVYISSYSSYISINLMLTYVFFIFLFILIATLLHSVPGNLILQVLSSTSIRATWTPPPNAERLPLNYHVCYSSEFTGRMSTSTTELSLVLTDLHPFDEYTVSVEAENNGGRGGPVVKKGTTLSAGMCVFLYYLPPQYVSVIL